MQKNIPTSDDFNKTTVQQMPIQQMFRVVTGTDADYAMSEYQVPKTNMFPSAVGYTMPKQIDQDFSSVTQKRAAALPAVGQYETTPKSRNITMGTFRKAKKLNLSDINSRSTSNPGPGCYTPRASDNKIKGGQIDRTSDSSWLSTLEYNGAKSPGVGSYNLPSPRIRSNAPRWVTPPPLQSDTNQRLGPGCYDHSETQRKLQRTPRSATLCKTARGLLENKRDMFKTPGVGHYNLSSDFNVWKGPSMRRR